MNKFRCGALIYNTQLDEFYLLVEYIERVNEYECWSYIMYSSKNRLNLFISSGHFNSYYLGTNEWRLIE